MMILFWLVFVLNVLCTIFAFIKTFTMKTTTERVASFIATLFHVLTLYFLFN